MKKPFLGILLLLLTVASANADNLWVAGGFESDLGWNAAADFVATNGTATDGAAINGATFYTLVHDNLLTESGKWVEDSSRAFEGNRMFWLRPYNDPDTICVGHRFDNVLTPGLEYQLSFKFAPFDENRPSGSTAITKPVTEVTSWDPTLGTSGEFVTRELPVTFSDGQTRDPDANTYGEFPLQDWNNINWLTATTNFVAPEPNGQPLYVWASMTNDSGGMLLDSISLRAVPEPAASVFAMAIMAAAVLRRRR